MYSLLLIMKKKMLKENGLQTKKRKKKKSQVATQGFVVRQWEQRRNKRPGAPLSVSL